jgi:hypothetical protein
MNSDISPSYLPNDKPNTALKVLSFLCPFAGFLIYFAIISSLPRQAISARSWAIRGIIFYVLAFVLVLISIWWVNEYYYPSSIAGSNSEVVVSTHPPRRN